MEKFDFTKDFTLADIATRDFYLYLKKVIKELEQEQRICKRDRKTVNHPCPDKRVYQPGYQLQWKIESNASYLHQYYNIIYFLKKNYKLNNFIDIKFNYNNGLYDYMNFLNEDYLQKNKFRYIGYVNLHNIYLLFKKYNEEGIICSNQ